MNPSIIRFHHFTSIQSYCKLQKVFGSFDYQRRFDDKIKIAYDDFDITVYSRDEFCTTEEFRNMNFISDFLIPGINTLEEVCFLNFRQEIVSKGLFSGELLENFAIYYIEKLRSAHELIEKAQYLNKLLITKLLVILKNLENRVEGFIENPYPLIKRKLEFNWKRTDVIVFFHLLRSNKAFEWIEDADLGRIIDNMVKYQSDEEDALYADIDNSRKHLNAFKNEGGRPDNEAISRLKKIFENPDFYRH